MRRPRASKRQLHAQRLAALACARSPETKIRHLRAAIGARERSLTTETEPAVRRSSERHLVSLREKLAALLAKLGEGQPTSAKAVAAKIVAADPLTVKALAELGPGWLPLAQAAQLLATDPGHLARRCRQSLAAAGLAARVEVDGASGPLRWFIARALDERLAEAQTATNDTSG